MSKRELALSKARVAGYHQDSKDFTRLIIESQVNRQTMMDAWYQGYTMKEKGIKCNCYDCRKEGI